MKTLRNIIIGTSLVLGGCGAAQTPEVQNAPDNQEQTLEQKAKEGKDVFNLKNIIYNPEAQELSFDVEPKKGLGWSTEQYARNNTITKASFDFSDFLDSAGCNGGNVVGLRVKKYNMKNKEKDGKIFYNFGLRVGVDLFMYDPDTQSKILDAIDLKEEVAYVNSEGSAEKGSVRTENSAGTNTFRPVKDNSTHIHVTNKAVPYVNAAVDLFNYKVKTTCLAKNPSNHDGCTLTNSIKETVRRDVHKFCSGARKAGPGTYSIDQNKARNCYNMMKQKL